ncbi:DUF6933 domain-containing protein [Agathobacter rectalis]|uniref:DUF6933 domain-containing protein n=1 Tax=Agathobacter rectalis TaxID=39491 RepID=UPI0027D2C8F6|nr:hypothetical protein [Agathobacter rectalis]
MDAVLDLNIKEDDKYYIAFDYVVDNQDIRNKYRMLKSITDVLFIVNASNRYTIAMTDIEPRNWNYYTMYIRSVIHGVMQEMGYSEDQIGQYFKMSGDTTVTKTHGRKSVGGINRMVMDAQYFGKKLEKEAKYQWVLSEYLNRDICQPEGFDAYGYPTELFKLDMERLGIVPKRKPAKVIDFTRHIDTNRSTKH